MKKQLLFFIALALCLGACNQKGNDFKVNVSLKNGNDQTVYLQKYVDNAPVTIDSAVIANEINVFLIAILFISILQFFNSFPSMIPCRIHGAFTLIPPLRSKIPKCSGPLPKLLLSQMKVENPRLRVSLMRNLQ